jgi:hypothetical protein
MPFQLFFATDGTQFQLAGAGNHQFQDVIDCIAVHAGSFRDELLNLRTDASQKGGCGFMSALIRLCRKYPP